MKYRDTPEYGDSICRRMHHVSRGLAETYGRYAKSMVHTGFAASAYIAGVHYQ